MDKTLSIKKNCATTYCDLCQEQEKTYVSFSDDRDICFDCVLEIYEFVRKEIL